MFTSKSAARMLVEGLAEEAHAVIAPLPVSGHDPVRFTPSALADWHFLASAKIIDAPIQYSELLTQGLALLRSDPQIRHNLAWLPSDGFVWAQDNLRWVLRITGDRQQIIVHGIAREAFDPFRKLWRYFKQFKAVDLLKNSELYLRRLDQLEADPFEGRATQPMLDRFAEVQRSVFGEQVFDPRLHFENQRRATYACCWQKMENESAVMWRDYCDDNAGLAIQSTERRLQHQFAVMQEGRCSLYFREVDYIDHATHNPVSHGFPEQAFLKRQKYFEERETRFAWFVDDVFCGTQEQIENALIRLDTGRRVPFDLNAAAETVVINPCASDSDRRELLQLIATDQPSLSSRVRASSLSMQ